MKVSDLMTKNVITIQGEKKVHDAAELMCEHQFSVLPVVNDQEQLMGILTESDFVGKEVRIPHALAAVKQLFGQKFYFGDVEELYEKSREKTIKDVMTKSVKTVSPNDSLNDLVHFMINHKLKRVPVVDQERLVGIVTRKDLIKAFVQEK